MLAILWLTLILGSAFVYLSLLHMDTYGHMNAQAIALILFLLINILICFWELCLCYRYKLINSTHAKRMKDGYYSPKSASKKEPIILMKDLKATQLLSMDFWAYIWIDYSKWDESYADKTTFGYCIDVGNGHSTLVPSVLLLWSIVQPLFSPKIVGMIGLLTFYQTWYGTVLYFYQYINNQRYKLTTWPEILGVVVFSNAIWFVFPMLGFYGSVRLIMEESFQVWQ